MLWIHMADKSRIVDKLKSALRTSCDDAFYFSDDETQLIDAEYLLTVNAAKAIQELNHCFGTSYKIRLEHDTDKFATACTPLFGREHAEGFLGYKTTIRSKNNTQRSGKIDVAVYTSKNGLDTPLCAIEVKGFNSSKKLITQDLERNAEYFRLASTTGHSSLPFAAFIALHSYKSVWSDKKESKALKKVTDKYKSIISENPNLSSLKHEIDVVTIRRGILPDPNDPHVQEVGLSGDEDYLFVGVIITSEQNPNQTSVT